MSLALFSVIKTKSQNYKLVLLCNPIKFILKAYLKTNSKSIDKNLQNKGQK